MYKKNGGLDYTPIRVQNITISATVSIRFYADFKPPFGYSIRRKNMNRFFIRLIGGAIACTCGLINAAKAINCNIGETFSGTTSYYAKQTCPATTGYRAYSMDKNFPGVGDTGNEYAAYTNQTLSSTSVPRIIGLSNVCETKTNALLAGGTFFVPCSENRTPFVTITDTDSQGNERKLVRQTCSNLDASSGLYLGACILDGSGQVITLFDDFFKTYGGCLCPEGQTCSNESGDSGDSGNTGSAGSADGCKFYYYNTGIGETSAYVFVGCRPGYYLNREIESGETFVSKNAIDKLCSPCSGMKYNVSNGTVSTYKPTDGETGANGIWWKSDGMGINSCYANGNVNDGAGTFSFETNCTYGG